MTPRFDDLVEQDLPAEERGRLERVHDLLVAAGPPPELSPEFEFGPTLAMTLPKRRQGRGRQRLALLAAALVVLALVFTLGYITGNGSGGGIVGVRTLRLAGTAQAPGALASLVLSNEDDAGNWPMKLTVTGLAKLPPRGYYEVFLARDGRPIASCGVFVVKSKSAAVTVDLNAPYSFRRSDGWVITRQAPGQHEPGPVVMHPLA
ncbi:MAG TPA: hypothetical protein VFA30_02930 [Gaiellaceae bacterium]|nr:hypothetical protein [Gaiellaceae bacterium]